MSMIKKTFHIPDMHCSACVVKLEGLEDDLPGVKMVQASYHNQSMLVEYDDRLLDETLIRDVIRKMGYTV